MMGGGRRAAYRNPTMRPFRRCSLLAALRFAAGARGQPDAELPLLEPAALAPGTDDARALAACR